MKQAMISCMVFAACATGPQEPVEVGVEGDAGVLVEPTVQAWLCGGDIIYFEWRCNTTIGAWEQVSVGDTFHNCGYPPKHSTTGTTTACHYSEQYACGGGDDSLCNSSDTCTFPPLTPCRRADPPPCCIGP